MNESFFKWMITANDKQYKMGLPILPIFLLGERIEGFENIPVLHISKQIKDRYTNEVLDQKNDFIDSLFHEGIIVNIPALSKKRRDELETLLSIFDQSQRSENFHIMNVVETDFPEKFRPIIRRLQNAAIDKELRDVMIIEDDFLSEINDIENQIVTERKAKEEAVRKQEEAVRKQEEAVRMLINAGIPKTIIATQLGMSIEEVEKINT